MKVFCEDHTPNPRDEAPWPNFWDPYPDPPRSTMNTVRHFKPYKVSVHTPVSYNFNFIRAKVCDFQLSKFCMAQQKGTPHPLEKVWTDKCTKVPR